MQQPAIACSPVHYSILAAKPSAAIPVAAGSHSRQSFGPEAHNGVSMKARPDNGGEGRRWKAKARYMG